MSLSDDRPPCDPLHQTRIWQERIDALSAAGGGRLEIPPGRWVCGALQLRSGVDLHLAAGSHLCASGDRSLFSTVGTNDPAITANGSLTALVWARDAEKIGISGSGTLDGGGTPETCPDWDTAQNVFRPGLVYLENCRGIRIEEVRLQHSKWWTVQMRRCQDIGIRAVHIETTWPNSDGIDPDGCRDVRISDCQLRCGDDCIVLKSTQGDDNENVVIKNCLLETHHACFKLGTESFGSFRDILVSDCVLRGPVGFGLYMKDGGCMEKIHGRNLTFDSSGPWPIVIDAMARDYLSGRPAGQIRDVTLSDCTLRGRGRVWLEGTVDQPLDSITLRNLDWHVTDPIPQPPQEKPPGSARVRIPPDCPGHHAHPEHILALHTCGLRVEGVHLHGTDSARPLLRLLP